MRWLHVDERRNGVDATIYTRYASTIFTYFSQQGVNRQDAEDLLLEVFIAALKCDTLPGLTDEQQLAWLRRVARNKVIDLYRHTALLSLVPLDQAPEMEDVGWSPEQRAVEKESYERLIWALEQLSPLQQQIVRLRYGTGMHLVEIAALLQKPEGTVRSVLSRTLYQLRAILDQE